MMRLVLAFVAAAVAFSTPAAAQVAQWNQVIADKALEKAFYRALREASIEYIDKTEAEGTPAVVTFVDSQLDYPLQLSTSNFRHVLLNAAQAKIGYLVQYQARTTAGVEIPIGAYAGFVVGVGGFPIVGSAQGARQGNAGGAAEIPGDGGVMMCPINKDGLEFMIGALAIASIDESGAFRAEQDGADIKKLRKRILEKTYAYYGHTPPAD